MSNSIWRHKKTGGLYQVVTQARVEATMIESIVYRSLNNGHCWVRPEAEFFDGRFEQAQVIDTPAPYTCKHDCERDALKDEITRLRAELAEVNENLTAAYMVGFEKGKDVGRDKALEEAAKMAEAGDLSIMSSTIVDVEARQIAATIRQMKGKS